MTAAVLADLIIRSFFQPARFSKKSVKRVVISSARSLIRDSKKAMSSVSTGSAVFTTITAYTPDAAKLSIFPMKGAISAATSASAEQLSRSSKTELIMSLS